MKVRYGFVFTALPIYVHPASNSPLAVLAEGSVQVSWVRVGYERLWQNIETDLPFVDYLNTTVTTLFIGVELPLSLLVEEVPLALGVDWGFSCQETSATLQPDGYGVFFRANSPDAPELFIQDGSLPDLLQEQAITAQADEGMWTLRFQVRYEMTPHVSAYVRFSKAARTIEIPRRSFTPTTGPSARPTLYDIRAYSFSADYFAFGFQWRLL